MFSSTVNSRSKWWNWNTTPIDPPRERARSLRPSSEVSSPSISTRPDVGRSSRPSRLSRVALPEPDCPIRLANSPSWSPNDTAVSARVAVSPSPYTFSRSSAVITSPTLDHLDRVEPGDLPGAMVVDRNELEWHLAPSSEHRGIEVQPRQKVIVVCNDGYQSSLAAAILQDLSLIHISE